MSSNLRKERAIEYLRCMKDPEYFIRNYVYIVHQDKGLIKFDMYDYQERALKDLFKYDYTIMLKARQMGMTTLLSAYALWLMVFQENKEVLALSYKQNKARNIIKKIKRMHNNLPSWMQETMPINNQLEVELGNGSKAAAESTTSDAGRSESASFVIIDEAAFIGGAKEVWSAVKLTLDVGDGNCAIISTPTGVGSFFHETWQKATEGNRIKKVSDDPEIWEGIGRNDFHPIKLHWSIHPNRDQEWRDEQARTMGEKKAARECFSGSVQVRTKSGLKPIRKIEVGDSVLTHKARYRKVKRTFSKIAETVQFCTSKNNSKKRVTLDHPVLNYDGKWKQIRNVDYARVRPQEQRNVSVNLFRNKKEIKVHNLEVEEDHSYVTEHFVAHNCDCDFSTSGDTVIEQETIKWYDTKAVESPMETHRRGKGDVYVWEAPQPGKTYLMASDVARGDGDDFSTFQIYTAAEMRQVAEYKGKMPPSDFGDLLVSYGTMYNDALLVIERNNIGYAAIQQVVDRQYPNLLYTSNDLKLVEVDKQEANSSKKLKPGLDTNRTTRGLIISTLQKFMREKWLQCKSERFVEELRTFIWKNHGTRQKPEHMEGYNDDLVFAAAFACWARDKALKYRAEMQQRSERSLENISGSRRVYSGMDTNADPYVQQVGSEKEDLRWLLS